MTQPTVAVLLAPGASAGRDQPALVAMERALASIPAAGPNAIVVERMDFPYRKAGRKAPDRQPVLVEAVRSEAASLAARTGLAPERLVLGGRSMGGRMCSIAVAEGLPACALVLVSYPLHPPRRSRHAGPAGKPDKLRTEHFPQLSVPCLFVSGTRDAFGSRDEMEAATAAIPGPVTHVWLEDGDHGLRRRDAEVAEVAAEFIRSLDPPG